MGSRHFKRQRIAQIVISQRVAHQHGQRVRLLPGGTAGAPDAQVPVSAFLFAADQFFQNVFVEQIQLRLVAEETGFVDGQIFQQRAQFRLALLADQQAVVA